MNLVHVGFTGSRRGMTPKQEQRVHEILNVLYVAGARFAHHGMCIGADEQFHNLAHAIGYTITGFPGSPAGSHTAKCQPEHMMQPAPFLVRNVDIVLAASVMIATPRETVEVLRSGTWMTIRCARKRDKPLYVVWPDGTFTP